MTGSQIFTVQNLVPVDHLGHRSRLKALAAAVRGDFTFARHHAFFVAIEQAANRLAIHIEIVTAHPVVMVSTVADSSKCPNHNSVMLAGKLMRLHRHPGMVIYPRTESAALFSRRTFIQFLFSENGREVIHMQAIAHACADDDCRTLWTVPSDDKLAVAMVVTGHGILELSEGDNLAA